MRQHIAALRALLAPLGYPVHYVDATGATSYPYLLLWSSAGRPGDEVPLDGARDDFDEPFGVTAVAANPDAVLAVAQRVRNTLVPDGRVGRLDVAGHAAWVRLEDSRPIDVDRDITIPASNRHPAFGADLYRLVSDPI